MIKAVIFDFNGTLFQDTEIHYIVWEEYVKELFGYLPENFFDGCKGNTNEEIFRKLSRFKSVPFTEEEITKYSFEKEKRYREWCINHNFNKLTNGAEEFFKYLKEHNYLMSVCTCACKENVDFLFDYLEASKYFDINQCIYEDGIRKGKEEYYRDAIKLLGVKPEETLCFEDSGHGIKGAIDAGCNVVVISRNKIDPHAQIKQVIQDFTYFDYNILNTI